jgi:hypothetical protein
MMRARRLSMVVALLMLPLAVGHPLAQVVSNVSAGVWVATPTGLVELPVFGERHTVNRGFPSFYFLKEHEPRVPRVSAIQHMYVNMVGWVPTGVALVVGRKGLNNPKDKFRGLNAGTYNAGPGLTEIRSPDFTAEALQAAYAELTKKAKAKDDVRAFVLLELVSDKGLDGRYYPVQIDVAPPATPQMR